MSLLDELSDVKLLVVDENQRLAYAWFGGAGVNVYDDEGHEVHYFTVGTPDGRKPTPRTVRAAIDRVRSSIE